MMSASAFVGSAVVSSLAAVVASAEELLDDSDFEQPTKTDAASTHAANTAIIFFIS